MGFLRFRRTFRIAPGLRLNLSKSGVSASLGRRGLWFTVGPRGTRETIGMPGTGLSYTEQQSIHEGLATLAAALPIDEPGRVSEPPASVAGSDGAPATSSGGSMVPVCIVLLVLVVIAILIWMR